MTVPDPAPVVDSSDSIDLKLNDSCSQNGEATDAIMKLEDFKRGVVVKFEWSAGDELEYARENGLRSMGRVVTRDDLPQMAIAAVGVQLLDDPCWVIDPAFAISKGKTFCLAESEGEAQAPRAPAGRRRTP